jgi:hypothetical protein
MRSAIDNFLGELRMAEGPNSGSYVELRDSIIELGTSRVPKSCRVSYVRIVKTSSGATQAMPLRRNQVAGV